MNEKIEWPAEIARVRFHCVSSDTEGLWRLLLAIMRQLVKDPNAVGLKFTHWSAIASTDP